MYTRLLLPTDGSDEAEGAVEQAIDIAEKYAAEIHVVHVINTRKYDTSIDSQVAPLRKKGNRYLERITERIQEEGIPVTTTLEMGRPGRILLEYVDENDIDLIVMGTRGRGGLSHRLLGTVTNYVVTHAEIPVHVSPAVEEND